MAKKKSKNYFAKFFSKKKKRHSEQEGGPRGGKRSGKSSRSGKRSAENTRSGRKPAVNRKNGKKPAGRLEGRFISNARGFGFVTVEGFEEDFFIPKKYTYHALNGDLVEILPLKDSRGSRTEAQIDRILERALIEVVGTFHKTEEGAFVESLDTKMKETVEIPKGKRKGAKEGDKVICTITQYPNDVRGLEGHITEILGHKNDVGVDILAIIKAYGIDTEFPEDVLLETEQIPSKVYAKDRKNRVDLRDEMTITIDGEDSKDFDDAISIHMEGENYILGVHIADVTAYVKEGSPLDVEALKRGTSIYFVDRVIPMLPEKLSNGICSLNEGVDRLALSCIMTINPKGKVIDYRICESVIRSNHRMTYPSVNRMLEKKDAKEIAKYQDVYEDLLMMEKVARLLNRRRNRRGSIDFELPEAHLILNEKGETTDIVQYDRGLSNRMIEEFMLLANETVAFEYCNRHIPFVYRIHEDPDAEKIGELKTTLQEFGVTVQQKKDKISPKEVQKMLKQISGESYEPFIMRLTLRSMQQAKYHTECRGHFGLADEFYCHFTSPIRRYPDLQIHRIIKEDLRHTLKKKHLAHYESILPNVCEQSSKRERLAVDVEREVEKLKKAEFMSKHLGDVYTGIISGVTKWGIFVELPSTVEGLVGIASLTDDEYNYSEETYELVGRFKNRHFRLGDSIHVQVAAVDVASRTIDFVVESMPLEQDTTKTSAKGKKRG